MTKREETNWEAIVNEHAMDLFAIASRILGRVGDAEDIVQEVFLEAFRLHERKAVPQWSGLLRRMAVCRALDRLRQRKVTVALDSLSLPPATAIRSLMPWNVN
jgi:RNA polymerase sigma-70 factor, ECF subfamily